MHIKRMKKGGRVYLAEYESYRDEDGKVKTRYIRYIGTEGDDYKVSKPKKSSKQVIYPERSYRSGDVTVLWQLAKELGLVQVIDQVCCGSSGTYGISPGKLLVSWAINRAIDPESVSQMDDWIRTTDLPSLMQIPSHEFSKDALLSALDFVCSYNPKSGRIVDNSPRLDENLYQRWRSSYPLPPGTNEIVAYDLTSVLLYGNTCPLSEKGYNPPESRLNQVNLTVLASRFDQYPLAHLVYPGNRHSISTVRNLLLRLDDMEIVPGTIIWDRGNTSQETIEAVESRRWNLLCGIPKVSEEAKEIVAATDVPLEPRYLVPTSDVGEIYAVKIDRQIFGRSGAVVVYTNIGKKSRDVKRRNAALFHIGNELDALTEKVYPAQVIAEAEIKEMVNGWTRFFKFSYHVDEKGYRFHWIYDEAAIENASRLDGKWILYTSNHELSARDIVISYFEKDFIEKLFRCLKTEEEIAPVRHRLEYRVRAYFFVCMLALRLRLALKARLHNMRVKDKPSVDIFLKMLGRVERAESMVGDEKISIYLNVSVDLRKYLRSMKMLDLFPDALKSVVG
jgi:hypothetical protein